MIQSPHALTYLSPGLVRVLYSKVQVGSAFDPKGQIPMLQPHVGIWDTGATASVITQKVIDECGLKPTGMTKAHGADGEYITPVFLVSIHLPNNVAFPSLRVTKGKLPTGSDMLLGMDVIGFGDFAVTDYQGQTCFTFRTPSSQRIDFTGKAPPAPIPDLSEVGPNDRCPCNSGRKYKKCHGGPKPPNKPI